MSTEPESSETPEKSAAGKKDSPGFSDLEKVAMKERARELKAAKTKAEDEAALLEKIAEMEGAERVMAERVHAIVMASAPDLVPRTWYGMPAYAREGGAAVCFFQSGAKFGSRYATLGFNDTARLDEGNMWPTAYALLELTPEVETAIAALVIKAVG